MRVTMFLHHVNVLPKDSKKLIFKKYSYLNIWNTHTSNDMKEGNKGLSKEKNKNY